MALVFFGPWVAVLFSPKILGLNTEIFGLFSSSLGLIFCSVCTVFFFFFVIAKKMNNMLVV